MCAPLAWSKASKPGLSRGAVAALSFGTIEGTPPSPVSSPDPAALFDRRLLLFTGKGGVGKSTVVASLALEAAARGKRPLIVELGHRHTMRSIFGVDTIVFNPGSAFASGNTFLIGLGATVFLLGLASLTLILDFRQAQDLVDSGAPKETEWYVAFGLIVSLLWIYFESLKLVLYITMMNRE